MDSVLATKRVLWLRLGALVVALATLATVTVVWGAGAVKARLDDVADGGWRGALAFVVLYAVATVLLVPGSASTATAGAVYGTILGATVAIVGATIGSVLAYAFARGAGRRPVETLLAPRAREAERWLSERQFRSILVARLLPIVPFNVFNYAAGLSAVRPRPYVVGTVVGLVPGALLVASLGSSARQPTSPAFLVSAAAAVAVTVASTVAARRRMRP